MAISRPFLILMKKIPTHHKKILLKKMPTHHKKILWKKMTTHHKKILLKKIPWRYHQMSSLPTFSKSGKLYYNHYRLPAVPRQTSELPNDGGLCHPPTNQQGQQLVAQRRRRKMEM
jgi:hypothetical protein